MTARTTRPAVVLALFARPQSYTAVIERLTSVHRFGTIVAEHEGEFWSRIAYRKPDVVVLERVHLELCRSMYGLGCPCVVIDDAPVDSSDTMDRFMAVAAAGARGVCFHPINDATLARMLTAAIRSKGEVALTGR